MMISQFRLRIQMLESSLIGMSPKRDIINITGEIKHSHYIMASTQMQSQKYLLSLLAHPSITTQTRNISVNNHEFHVTELKVKEGFQKLFSFTRLVLVGNSSQGQLECCQKILQVKEYDFDGISSQSKNIRVTMQNFKKEHGGEEKIGQEIKNIYQNNKSLQIIRVDQPCGDDIYVSYAVSIDRWIISSKRQTTFCSFTQPIQENISSNQSVIQILRKTLLQCSTKMPLLRETFAKYTISGKVNYETKQIKWYFVNSISVFNTYCEDPFDAKSLLQKCGLLFTKIKTLSVLNNQDKIIRALQNIVSNVRSDVSQSKNKVLGRCTVLLVSISQKKVLNCFHVLTIEDVILAYMKELFISSSSKEQKVDLFKSYLEELKQYKKFNFPFPSQHYISMFQKSLEVIQLCKLTDKVGQKYLEIIKFTLYAELKKIDLQKFGGSLPWDKALLQQIDMFSLEQLSPINCSTIILYNFVLPNCKIKDKMIETLKLKYQQLSLHFDYVKIQNQEDLSAINLKPSIQSSINQHKISHIVIDFNCSLFQLKALLKEFQNMNFEKCYFRMVVVCEKVETQTLIGDNYFPFSWQTIGYFYSEIFRQNLKLGKIQQRCKKLEQVTNYLLGMKNEQFSRWQDRIEVSMAELKGCSKELRRNIQQIMQSQPVKVQKYYALLIQLQKSNVIAELNYQETVQSIISRSYTPIKFLDLQTK